MVMLIVFRALQGFGAGGVQPIATTILGDIYTPTERAHIQGLVSSVFGVAAVLGPLSVRFWSSRSTGNWCSGSTSRSASLPSR